MPKYILVNGVIFNGDIHPQGEVVELSESDAEAYVERGSIKPYVEGEEEQADEPTPIEGEVVEEFVFDEFTYKAVKTAEGVKYTQNNVEVSQDAFESQRQTVARQELEAKQAEEAPVAPEVPVVPDPSSDPTPEQIANDLKAAGV